MPERFTLDLAGKTLIFETGELAKQANGAVLARYGDTMVLVAATASASPRQGIDFFPLTVDYEERLYSVGKIPGGFIKREGRPSEKAILAGRLTDRPIRPLFPAGFRNDVQIIATVMSVDYDHAPDILAMNGASAALAISDIPFGGPIGAVSVGLVNGTLVVNPTKEQAEQSDLQLTVAGTKDAVMMVEAGAREVPEETMLAAIALGHRHIQEIVAFIEGMAAKIGKAKREIPLYQVSAELEQAIRDHAAADLEAAVMTADKQEREAKLDQVQTATMEHFLALYPEQGKDIDSVLHSLLKEMVRASILSAGTRPDGRKVDEIRPLSCDVGRLPRTHGSGLFTRGQTQVLSVVTLGPMGDVQILDGLGNEEFKRYMHHYNFPPYSVGETRPMRGPGRREIGHGALAERALEPMIPSEQDFPYAIRVVSEVLESNGSTSMGSVCGSTLALMDAGVPLKAPVAGVAMGLVKGEDKAVVLTDIQGIEDALGDMDFKVAGTEKGITALQMDMKISGVSQAILAQALAQAREGRLFILRRMLATLPAPRPELSPFAPRIIVMNIDPEKIREVIGPGGKMINRIIAETNVKIDIEDDGRVFIAAISPDDADRAVAWIERLTRDVEVGAIYTGKVTRLMNFGAFVEVLPGKEGLVHISQLAEERVAKVEDVVAVGDTLMVKVTEIDKQGRVNLSHREVLRAEKARLAEKG